MRGGVQHSEAIAPACQRLRTVCGDALLTANGPAYMTSACCGREAEIQARGHVAAGGPAIVLVEGEAGIGKTRLLARVLADARGRGMQVAAGRGTGPAGRRALGPRGDSGGPGGGRVAGQGGPPGGAAVTRCRKRVLTMDIPRRSKGSADGFRLQAQDRAGLLALDMRINPAASTCNAQLSYQFNEQVAARGRGPGPSSVQCTGGRRADGNRDARRSDPRAGLWSLQPL